MTSRRTFPEQIPAVLALGRMIRKRRSAPFFFTLLALMLCCVGASAAPERTVRFISGNPLFGYDDKTGGFGDVTANVHAALAWKKRFPMDHVQFIVTSLPQRVDPHVHTTNEVMKVLIPDLDPKRLNQWQSHGGVDFLFLAEEPFSLLDMKRVRPEDPLSRYNVKSVSPELWSRLVALLPKANLSVQLSANTSPMRAALQANADLSISANELTGLKENTIDHMLSQNEKARAGYHLHLHSGFQSMGVYLDARAPSDAGESPDPQNEKRNRSTVRNWLASRFGLRLAPRTLLTFSYVKSAPATQLYLDAVARVAAGRSEPFLSVIPPIDGLDLSSLPSHVQVLKVRDPEFEMIDALISASAFSPLVRGDVSLSQALSRTTPRKTLVYEVSSWKEDIAAYFRLLLGGSRDSDLPLLIEPEKLPPRKTPEWEKKVEALAGFLTSAESQEGVHRKVSANRRRWDLLGHLDQIQKLHVLLGPEIAHDLLGEDLLSTAIRGVPRGQTVLETGRQGVLESDEAILIPSALLLLKLGERLEPEILSRFFEAIERSSFAEHAIAYFALHLEERVIRDMVALRFAAPAGEKFKKIILAEIGQMMRHLEHPAYEGGGAAREAFVQKLLRLRSMAEEVAAPAETAPPSSTDSCNGLMLVGIRP